MAFGRARMTVRLVSLHSPEASESRVEGTPSERLALVGRLSAQLWERTKQSLPKYDRATMPVCFVPRQRREGRDA